MNMLQKPDIAEKIKKLTIISATDGNHGRGLAWAGKKLGCKVLIYMPKATTKERAQAIRNLGAEVTITDLNYDDTLRVVIEQSEQNKTYLHVQDTAWEGYSEIPNWISQGYMTIADEAITQIRFSGYKLPTHVFLQAGAGSFALGIIGHLATTFGDKCPKIIIMEPKNANCFYESIIAQGSKPIRVHGDLETMMAGLSVGEVSTEAWKLISNYANAYIMCDDSLSAKGTRLLASPLGDDKKIISGESGSIGIGVLEYLMTHDSCNSLRTELEITESSNILVFSTEGNTDSNLYNQIVYNGHIQSI
jgi:diaminopropionate ammonia-lyase